MDTEMEETPKTHPRPADRPTPPTMSRMASPEDQQQQPITTQPSLYTPGTQGFPDRTPHTGGSSGGPQAVSPPGFGQSSPQQYAPQQYAPQQYAPQQAAPQQYPVMYQPGPQVTAVNQTNVNVVMANQGVRIMPQNQKGWSSSLCCNCCDAGFGHCMLVCFCPLIATIVYAKQMGEHCCSAWCLTLYGGCCGVAMMRTKLRTMLGISGSICGDLCAVRCCNMGPVLIQMKSEMDKSGVNF